MNQTIRLRVVAPILTVDAKDSTFITVSKGSILETVDDLAEPGLHRVRWHEQTLLAFTRDIEERTQRVAAASVG